MLLSNFVFIIGIILIGIVARKASLVPAEASDGINKYVLNIALPAIILLNVPQLKNFQQLVVPVTIHWISFFLVLGLIYLCARLWKFNRETYWTLVVCASLGNTAFLGIPMVGTFFGEESVIIAILYDQLGSGFGFILIAAFFIPLYKKENVGNFKKIIKDLIKFPPFVALVIALCLKGVVYPDPLQNLLEKISTTLVPMAMFVVGLNFTLRIPKENLTPVAVGLSLKLLVVPLIILGVLKLTLLQIDNNVKVSVFQSGMPPMVTASILAINVGLNRRIAISLVGLGLFFSFITLFFLKTLI